MKVWPDVTLAIILAAVFATIVDALRVGSLVRGALRKLKNRFAQVSEYRIRRRIRQLTRERERLQSFRDNDRTIILLVLRSITVGLIVISFAIVLLICTNLELPVLSMPLLPKWINEPLNDTARANGNFVAVAMFAGASVIFLSSFRYAYLDTMKDLELQILIVSDDIHDLEQRLGRRSAEAKKEGQI